MNPAHTNSNSRRQAIDAQIKSLEDSIRALRLERNALAPVSSLPPEVIATIFSFLPHMLSAITCTTLRKNPDPLLWLRISHVCHQWREIALNQPLFWSHVDFTNISLAGAAEILARAKMMPLYLEARDLGSHWDDAQISEFQKELQLHVSRIRYLLISSAKFLGLRNTLKGLVSPAPTLESLSLSSEVQRPLVIDQVPGTLFGGTTPRLSSLVLSKCNFSWESSLLKLKSLQCLEIRSPHANTRSSLQVWLNALNEMRQLKRLTLHSASPIASHISIEVKRTATLPSLTHLYISGSANNCALALAHLDLPALTWLCIEAIVHSPFHSNVQKLFSCVGRHAHGPHDTQPLQSALVFQKGKYMDILAWTTPDIDVEAHDSFTSLSATLTTRVALSLTSKKKGWYTRETRYATTCTMIAALPLDNLVTLIVKQSMSTLYFGEANTPKWPLLRRLRLTPDVFYEFVDSPLAYKGGHENPLLPSLKELVLVDCTLYKSSTLRLYDALMKRVEQGVPLEMLDLRTCHPVRDFPAAVQLLSGIVVDVLGPAETADARAQITSMWDGLDCGPFVGHENADDNDSGTSTDEYDED